MCVPTAPRPWAVWLPPGRPVQAALLLLFLGGAGCAPGMGPGADIALVLQTSQRIEADVNRGLAPGEHDALLQGALDAGLVLDVTTKRALLRAELGVDSRYFIGENPDLAGEGQINPYFSVSGNYRSKDITLRAGGSLRFQPTETTQLDDTGLVNVDTQQITTSANLGAAYQLDVRNNLDAGLNVRLIDFVEAAGGLVPTRTIAASLAWQRALTGTSTLTTTLGLRQFWADNLAQTRSQTADFSVGLEHRRTPRHTFRVNGGISVVRTKDGAAPTFDIGFTGAAGLTYRLGSLSTSFDLTQSIEPSSVGALQAFTRAQGGLTYAVNEREALGTSLSLARRTDVSNDGTSQITLLLSPRYTWRVAENTSLSLGYTLRMSDNAGAGFGFGHKVLLSLNHDFELTP